MEESGVGRFCKGSSPCPWPARSARCSPSYWRCWRWSFQGRHHPFLVAVSVRHSLNTSFINSRFLSHTRTPVSRRPIKDSSGGSARGEARRQPAPKAPERIRSVPALVMRLLLSVFLSCSLSHSHSSLPVLLFPVPRVFSCAPQAVGKVAVLFLHRLRQVGARVFRADLLHYCRLRDIPVHEVVRVSHRSGFVSVAPGLFVPHSALVTPRQYPPRVHFYTSSFHMSFRSFSAMRSASLMSRRIWPRGCPCRLYCVSHATWRLCCACSCPVSVHPYRRPHSPGCPGGAPPPLV